MLPLRPLKPYAIALLIAGALASASGCGGGGEPGAAGAAPGAGERPPIILISIDTLRWDHVPAYGYEGVETPAIDAFRSGAILFERAYTHVPMTLPAHASLLTGLLPPSHGVRANMGYTVDGAALPFLPRLLKERGYATGAAVSSFVLRRATGMAAGFDFYEDDIDYEAGAGWEAYQRPGDATLEAALPWLRSAAESGPFFFFFHIYEPHAPYEPPEPYASRYALAYDGEIARADEIVGRLLAELERLGVFDRAVIALVSDHGDALGDHDEPGHGIFVYRSTMQVPLLLKLPGGRLGGASVASPAQLADLAPTLLELAGAAVPEELPGRSLVELATDEGPPRPIYGESYYTRLYFGWSELRTLTDGAYQYIESPEPELYDLTTDPEEKENVLLRERRVAAEMRRELAAIAPRFGAPAPFDNETRRKMEALGYIGGARSGFRGELPPPASQVDLLAELRRGFADYAAGRYRQAAATLRQVLAVNPHIMTAWERLALSLERMGRLEEAVAAYEEALERSGGEPQLALDTAQLLLALDRLDDAREHAELALDWDPAAAREILARIALARGDLDEAERQATAGLGYRNDPLLLFALARVERQRGRLPEALSYARQAEGAVGERRLPGLYLLKGDLLVRLGQPADAEAAFRHEVELFPRDPHAYSNLAFLYAATGRQAQAVAVLRQLVEHNPSPGAYAAVIETLRTLGDKATADAFLKEARRKYPQHPGLARF